METVVSNIQPILFTALVGVIIAYARYVNTLKTRVAVLEKIVENMTDSIKSMKERLDSHSKKQDEIYDTLTAMKLEIVKEMGKMASNVSSLASDLKGLNNLLAISDYGIIATNKKCRE